MKRLITFLSLLFITVSVFSSSTPVFIFQKNGKIDVVNSEDIVTIETIGDYEKPGNEYKAIFHNIALKDSTISYLVENVDSVVFGNKQTITPKLGVKRIDESELPYISGYSENVISYLKQSPQSIIPIPNTKIFHDTFCSQFPYGICALVEEVTEESDKIKVKVKELAPDEIFDEYFIGGNFELSVPVEALTRNGVAYAGTNDWRSFDFNISHDNFELYSQGKLTIRFENFVGSPVRNYYHTDIYVGFETELGIKATTEDSGEIHLNSTSLPIPLGTIGGILSANLNLSLFLDFIAECSINYELQRTFSNHYEWTRDGDDNKFVLINDSDNNGETNDSKAEFILNGNLHFGPQFDLTFCTLFNHIGAGIRTKIGPYFESEIGFGIVQSLEETYDPEIYAKANFMTSLLTRIDTYTYYNDFMMNRHEIPLPFNLDIELFKRKHELLPEFSSKSVKKKIPLSLIEPSESIPVADISSISNRSIEMDLEIGYQLIDTVANVMVYEEFLDKLYESNSTKQQVFNNQIPIEKAQIDNLKIYPIMRYGEYKLKGAPASINDAYGILPMFYQCSTNSNFIVAGASVIGDKIEESKLCIVGNILPVVANNNKKNSASTIHFIENITPILGKWKAFYEDKEIIIQFNEDKSCEYNALKGNYEINSPQGAYVTMIFPENQILILKILSLGTNELIVNPRNSNAEITFKR